MLCKPGVAILRALLFTSLLITLPSPLVAQQTQPQPDLTLDDIFLRLEQNLASYRASVPNFFCDEYVVSNMTVAGRSYRRTTIDSIFRLKRSTPDTSHIQFTESREIKAVNKKPTQDQSLSGPAIFTGAFSDALNVVSLQLQRCYDYHLVPHQKLHHDDALVIDYALKETVIDDKACPGPERHSGKVFIDPQTMQVVRLEMRTPNHESTSGALELWTWSIDYSPVAFNNNSFWMPKTITSTATANSQNIDWSFVATYRNYHKLTVTSRILPDVNYDSKQ
jgi:hypothetical protein